MAIELEFDSLPFDCRDGALGPPRILIISPGDEWRFSNSRYPAEIRSIDFPRSTGNNVMFLL